MKMYPIVIDLFCGCGGISTGLLDAGLAVQGGFDIEARSIEVYNYNHNYRGAQGFQLDLSKSTGVELLQLLNLETVDLLVGGAPCQSFSIVGSRKGLSDPRGHLIFDFIRYVAELKPKAFLLENVPNLQKIEQGTVFNGVIQELELLGYTVKYAVLSAADYGVPQNRKRIFILGTFGQNIVNFPPPPTHFQPNSLFVQLEGRPAYKTCKAVLNDLPDVNDLQAEGIPNHEPTFHNDAVIAQLKQLQPGTRDKKYFYDRLHPDRPSYTLRAGSGNFTPLRPIHYHYHRVISVRESARLQGFSDEFIWADSIPRLQQYRQVGNAVCPPIAEALGQFLCNLMQWERNPDLFKGDSQNRPALVAKTKAEKIAERTKRIRGASLGLHPV
ncbi:MAG: DNA cytosine methyltransferase [Microcoleaceae cyanobacterium]